MGVYVLEMGIPALAVFVSFQSQNFLCFEGFEAFCAIMAADRFSINKSWDQIQAKYVGTGHSDMTKYEWAQNQHRDTIASHVAHYDMLSYFAVAQNDSIGRVRYQLLEVSKTLFHSL